MSSVATKKNLANLTLSISLLFLVSACSESAKDKISELTNQSPTVSAAGNITADEQTTVTLTATASDSDGSISQYQWTQTAGTNVTLNASSSNTASFLAPDVSSDETLSFTIEVVDDNGATDTDTVNVNIIRVNQTPIAEAGQSVNTEVNQSVTLSGIASSDGDSDPLTYTWSLTPPNGSSTTLSSANTATPSLTPDVAGEYTATLIVNDSYEDSPADTVIISAIATTPAEQIESSVSGTIFHLTPLAQ
ncbi:PKD domain-containing protein [Paraglaciecola sp. L3A3]|uniref:PKD domain-containing protein n=1 Tax=Paraglaciecola sp. L3A3 TaxID=2686358 RepID=UPI00131B7522|nr:PKD domain-containing protein [Paraglaciecola sp. L3A3]